MSAQSAAKPALGAQTPPLPQAKPESLGLSSSRLQRMSDVFQREIDKGTMPGATVMVARGGQIGWFDALGKQDPSRKRADDAGYDLPHLFHDQADRFHRHHDAARGRSLPARRRYRQIHPGICQPESRRRKQRPARSRAAEAADHHPGFAAPHLRHHLRTYRQRSGAAALSAVAGTQPQDR